MTMLSILATAHRISRPISLIGRRPVTLANGQPHPSTRRREPSWSDSAGVREAIAFFDRLPSLAAGVKEHTHPVEIVEHADTVRISAYVLCDETPIGSHSVTRADYTYFATLLVTPT